VYFENTDGIVIVFTFDNDVVHVTNDKKVGFAFIVVQMITG
jgi:hypothetical protein